MNVLGYAAHAATDPLVPFSFERREPRPDDVVIDILYCGVCHTDLHLARNHRGFTTYPIVPGHEIIGRVSRVGAGVTRFKPGDTVGVGCMVDSCRHCLACDSRLEQHCAEGVQYEPVRHDDAIRVAAERSRTRDAWALTTWSSRPTVRRWPRWPAASI